MSRKTYLVSGAGSGIGRASAIRLAEEGGDIILLGRDLRKLKDTLNLLPRTGDHALAQADTRDASSLRQALKASGVQRLSGVIANAGVGGANSYGPKDRWDEVLDTNLAGTYRLFNEALPFLRRSQDPFKHVVVISSILARLGVPGYSAYCASKAGLLGLVRSWAAEFARERILVNAVCPGWVDTEMAREGIASLARATRLPPEAALRRQMSLVPLGKMSRPDEIASMVAWLVGGEQDSLTGQALDINNGALMP